MSASAIHHDFREVTGMSPIQYLKKTRLSKARDLIVNDNFSSANAGYAVGYSDPSNFSREFKRHFGAGPKEMR